jgi:hypothetical protein
MIASSDRSVNRRGVGLAGGDPLRHGLADELVLGHAVDPGGLLQELGLVVAQAHGGGLARATAWWQ